MTYTVWFKGDDFTATFHDYAESTHYADAVHATYPYAGVAYTALSES